jgi:uncharacterized phiE125 gp8 family phage protein
MATNTLIIPPTIEPVTLEELKSYARISHGEDDTLLTSLLTAAREWCERYAGLAFIAQTWRCAVSETPSRRELALARAPLINVAQILVYDTNGNATAWDRDQVVVDTDKIPGRIVLKDSCAWPDLLRTANGMIVEYRAGYGETGAAVPEALRLAIKQLALHWYDHRDTYSVDNGYHRVPLGLEAMLQTYRIFKAGTSCA